MPHDIRISIATRAEAPLAQSFAAAVGMDAQTMTRARGPLPGVDSTQGHNGAWSAIGQKRELALSNKSSVTEELVAFTQDSTYAYRITGFSGFFGALITEARGEWHFTMTGAQSTKIDWTYFFTPKGGVSQYVAWLVVKLFWPGYLRDALGRVKAAAEAAP